MEGCFPYFTKEFLLNDLKNPRKAERSKKNL